jgi:hypothetical protein
VRRAAACAVAAALISAPAVAQTSSRPGPWVLDVRGTTSPVPTDPDYYPPQAAVLVPARGFGADVGGHVYLFNLGPARLGIGASVMTIRSTADAAAVTDEDGVTTPGQRLVLTMRTVAPQVSFNFGTRDGWSYLSAGIGTGSVNTEATGGVEGSRKSGQLRAVNIGGGARWFFTSHVAFGFDLRLYQIAAGDETDRNSMFAVGAGLSFR